MFEIKWYDPFSDFCNGFILAMALNGTTWDVPIMDGEEDGIIVPEYYGADERLIAVEMPVEGEDYIEEEDVEDYPYPHRPAGYDVIDWCKKYFVFIHGDDLEDLFNTPLAVTKENGFFVFAVGFPDQDGGYPAVEIFYSVYGDNMVKHFTWHIDNQPRFLFQDGSFVYAILNKLRIDKKLPDSINPYIFFENCKYVKDHKKDLDWICENN